MDQYKFAIKDKVRIEAPDSVYKGCSATIEYRTITETIKCGKETIYEIDLDIGGRLRIEESRLEFLDSPPKGRYYARAEWQYPQAE